MEDPKVTFEYFSGERDKTFILEVDYSMWPEAKGSEILWEISRSTGRMSFAISFEENENEDLVDSLTRLLNERDAENGDPTANRTDENQKPRE